MVILTTSYNCGQYIERCIYSLMSQSFKNFTCYITDDMSTDNTVDIIKKTIVGDSRFILVENKNKMYQPGNYDQIIRGLNIPDDVICVEVDGDDWLPNPHVLKKLNDIYSESDIWMTSGSFKYHDGRNGFASKPNSFSNIRKQTFTLSHMRTWKSWLWKKIKVEDLKDEKGEYWNVAGDLAFMFPMFEMSGPKHYKFIDEIMYVYNESNPLNDHKVNMSNVNVVVNKIRNKKPYESLDNDGINPHELLSTYRFDVIIKYMYAKSILKNIDTDFFKNLYKEHLRIWNGFKEYDNKNKNNFEDFDNEFKKIIDSMKNDGFNPNHKIPVVEGKYIVNGAHRLAAALSLNKEVYTRDANLPQDGQKDCSWWGLFKNLNLSPSLCDTVAVEYSKLKTNTLVVTLFPTVGQKINETINIIKKYGNIFYIKRAELEKNGPLNLMRELYVGEPWAGNHTNNWVGFRQKEQLCYSQKGSTYFLLVEFDSDEKARKAKEDVRKIIGVGNHSIHINDTHEQTVRLSKSVFNDNSITFLNNCIPTHYDNFEKKLEKFKKFIDNNNLDIDEYSITASGVLSAYGLREGNDLDYIHSNEPLAISDKEIQSHNNYGVGLYEKKYDELIFNPQNYFHTQGVKFLIPKIILELKNKRNEPKDIIDINLLMTII